MSSGNSNDRWLVLLPVLAALMLTSIWFASSPRDAGDPNSLVVYCAHDSVYADAILKDFEQQTRIRVDVRYDTEATKSLGLVNLIVAERRQPRCDLFWNNELLGTADLKEQGLLEPYQGSGWRRLPEKYRDADGYWVGFAARLRVQIINTRELFPDDETMRNLFEFEPSSVAIAKPLFGTTLTHYTVLWHEWGPERLKEWHHDLRLRGVREVDGNGAVKDLVAQGVCSAGLTDTDDFYVAIDDGRPVAMLPVRVSASPMKRSRHTTLDFQPASLDSEIPLTVALSPEDGGEGTNPKAGEQPSQGDQTKPKNEEPLTLTLSPRSRGEGTKPKTDRPSLVVLTHLEESAGAFVRQHLEAGGTVLIAARSAESGTATLKQCGLDDVSLKEATTRRDAMLGEIDFEHPLFAPFAEAQFSDFTGIRFWKHRTIVGFGAAGGGKIEGERQAGSLPHGGRMLSRFDDGSPAFVEFTVGKGRVWLMTAGWHPADSQLARSSKFPPLVYRMLEQASGAVSRPESLPVGSAIEWRKDSGSESSRAAVSITLPDGSVVNDTGGDTAVTIANQPGLYGLASEDRTETVAVNLAAEESRTAPLPIEQLESLGVRIGAAEKPEDVRRAKDRERQLQLVELEQTQKLWRWGLLAVIGLLLVETWLAGRHVAA